jgi:hypothetical protein
MFRTNSLFNQENITHIHYKFKLFKAVSKEIQILLDTFEKNKNIEKLELEKFCEILLRFQLEFSQLFNFIQSSDFLITKEETVKNFIPNNTIINS